MDYESVINNEIEITNTFLNTHFNYTTSVQGETDFMKNSMNTIMSIKLWKDMLKEYNIPLNGTEIYIEEIISNLNQVIVLALLGFKIPAHIMIRRSQESFLSFIYYKDHPVEYIQRQTSDSKRNNTSIETLKEYIKNFPFAYMYEINEQQMKNIISRILEDWAKQYKELSHYVHGTNGKYCDLKQYLDDISTNEACIKKVESQVVVFSSIFNILMVVFFYNTYTKFDQIQKEFIRKVICSEFKYKRDIMDLGLSM